MFCGLFIVHEDHKAANSRELSVNKGDNIGIIDKEIGDGYWEVNYHSLGKLTIFCNNYINFELNRN